MPNGRDPHIIREKLLSEAVFAADLGDVLSGTAPEEYKDPRLFFEKTYLTGGLKNLARNVQSVFLLATSFDLSVPFWV